MEPMPPPSPVSPLPASGNRIDYLASCFDAERTNQGVGNAVSGTPNYASDTEAAYHCLTSFVQECDGMQRFQVCARSSPCSPFRSPTLSVLTHTTSAVCYIGSCVAPHGHVHIRLFCWWWSVCTAPYHRLWRASERAATKPTADIADALTAAAKRPRLSSFCMGCERWKLRPSLCTLRPAVQRGRPADD